MPVHEEARPAVQKPVKELEQKEDVKFIPKSQTKKVESKKEEVKKP